MLLLKRLISLNLLLLLASCNQININNNLKKNVLIILADDLGYTDLGCYGSEIETPNIDKLALKGTIFSNFYTSPLCAPSRAMLLTGNDNHTAGIGIQSFSSNYYGYEGILSKRVAIIPEVLKTNGYRTYMAGKWHLGGDPIERGFDKTYALLPGAFTHYDNNKPIREYPDSAFSENGIRKLWKTGNYSSDFYTDKIIEFIKSNSGKPFFAYASYTAPHWPLQVDKKYSDKYKGKYDEGYEALKIKRFENLKANNFISKNTKYPSFNTAYPKWETLSNKEKAIESKKMEIYAGMIDNLDYNIGRIINFLKDIGEYDNTIIVFMSDNGAAGEDFYYNNTYGNYIQKHFTYAYEEMGKPNSFVSLGVAWAESITAPFKLYKGYATSGGMRSPLIIKGLENNKLSVTDKFLSILDIAPSLYDYLEIDYPKIFNSSKIEPLDGISILPYIDGYKEEIHSKNDVFAFEHSGNSMLKKGNWKIINLNQPFKIDNFNLYSTKDDISELYDKKTDSINVYNGLIMEWEKFSKSKKLIFPTPYIDNLN